MIVTQENNGEENWHGQRQGPQHRGIRGFEQEQSAIRTTKSPTDFNIDYYNLIFRYHSKQKTTHSPRMGSLITIHIVSFI